jgi:hypothetical protein
MKFLYEPEMNRILAINWFSEIGCALNTPGIICAASVDKAFEQLSSIEWENTTLEAGNELASRIDEREYQSWNDIAEEARPFVDGIVAKKIRQMHKSELNENHLLPDVTWNVMHYIIETPTSTDVD